MTAFLHERQARRLALAVAGARIVLGITALLAPDVVARPWIGDEGRGPGRRVLARALGGRDVALGLGAVLAARHDGQLRGWVEGAVLADTVDAAATLIAFGDLPAPGRLLVLAAAASGVAAGAMAASSL